jgi:hypothetical protein
MKTWMGWLIVTIVVLSTELALEVTHAPTLTASVRSLPVVLRAAVVVAGVALLAHLVLPQRLQRHDPIDRFEHKLHARFDYLFEQRPSR